MLLCFDGINLILCPFEHRRICLMVLKVVHPSCSILIAVNFQWLLDFFIGVQQAKQSHLNLDADWNGR